MSTQQNGHVQMPKLPHLHTCLGAAVPATSQRTERYALTALASGMHAAVRQHLSRVLGGGKIWLWLGASR